MPKREGYITWKQYFVELALLSAKRSKDPNTQVGAVLVDEENRIISIGYNGLPRGCSDDDFSWNKGEGLDNKYLYVVHAEVNAILNTNKSPKDSILYTTLFPCNECAKILIQSGIKKIYYLDKKEGIKLEASMKMFDKVGIEYEMIK